MSRRNKIGQRRYRATLERHDATETSDHGNPTYSEIQDWDIVLTGWPCEITTTGGEENTNGGTISGITTHVLYGAFAGGNLIEPKMRLEVDGVYYSVVAAYDPDGMRREIKVEARREIE